jgi:nucleoside-diphosphate-sugar epimerase
MRILMTDRCGVIGSATIRHITAGFTHQCRVTDLAPPPHLKVWP